MQPLREQNHCSFPGCTYRYYGKGYCRGHWYQMRRGETLTELNGICVVVGCTLPWVAGSNRLCNGHSSQQDRGQDFRPLKTKRPRDRALPLHRVENSTCSICGPIQPHGRNKRRCPNSSRQTALYTKYGLSLDEWRNLHEQQAGGCAICGATDRVLHVDHDHITGAVRGLLCLPCNRGIGLFADEPAVLRAAAEYLDAHRSLSGHVERGEAA